MGQATFLVMFVPALMTCKGPNMKCHLLFTAKANNVAFISCKLQIKSSWASSQRLVRNQQAQHAHSLSLVEPQSWGLHAHTSLREAKIFSLAYSSSARQWLVSAEKLKLHLRMKLDRNKLLKGKRKEAKVKSKELEDGYDRHTGGTIRKTRISKTEHKMTSKMWHFWPCQTLGHVLHSMCIPRGG